jgi:RimJ/RimL family protein N-acetyltransferase
MTPARSTAGRLILEPLRVGHAAEMAIVLAAPELYRFTGGRPPTIEELRGRYARQVAGRSPGGTAGWRNWVIRTRADGTAVGFVQATLTGSGATLSAALAWTVGAAHQRRGYAREATAAAVALLGEEGVGVFTAHIAPGHAASAAVARSLGLAPTGQVEGGEVLWRTPG